MSRCPEALYGAHGEPNTSGNCPYCSTHLGRERVGRSTRSLTPWELDRIDVRAHRDRDGHVGIPAALDPEIEEDDDAWYE